MDSLTFLENPKKAKPQPVYALTGDEDFLKRQVLLALRATLLEGADNDFSFSAQPGDKATFAAVHDELETMPFVGPRRLVVVDNADPFVTKYRPLLEKYVAHPAGHSSLVLDVKTWPATTKLARALDGSATITCKAPAAYKLPEWCVHWVLVRHGKQLAQAAAKLLVDLAGADMGVLDQELAKLAVYVGQKARIEAADVDKLVGNSREENTWKIFDTLGAGRPRESLALLNRLFDQGEEPIRLLGAFSMQLRRLAQVARLCQQGKSLAVAMGEAGIPPFAQKGVEQQLKHLGRRRTDQLYDWLLEVDLGIKGSSQLPPRTLLERLVLRLAWP